jgi:hypothetical protein
VFQLPANFHIPNSRWWLNVTSGVRLPALIGWERNRLAAAALKNITGDTS